MNAISMGGTPPNGALNTSYEFTPTVSDTNRALRFKINRLPPGMTFDSASGRIFGSPSAVGTTDGIVISVTESHRDIHPLSMDQDAASASLGPFSITVN